MDLAHVPDADGVVALRPATRQHVDLVIQALSGPTPSLESIRVAVVRYARASRHLEVAADEMLAELTPRVRRCLDAHPAARGAELIRYVEWWAIHGYHGAD